MDVSFDDIDISTLTKADLCTRLFDELGLNKREASDFVENFFSIIFERLAAGEDVRLSDFAAFHVRAKSSREARNPRTGEPVQIAPRRVVTFKSGPRLKAKIDSRVD